jgi:MbtH protein
LRRGVVEGSGSIFDDETRQFKVVLNHEEQYSIWPSERPNPPGWRDAGKVGKKQECLEYIKEVWTDMRPLSLRKRMERQDAEEV